MDVCYGPKYASVNSSSLVDIVIDLPQLTFTCSKSTVETLEKGVKLCSKLTIKTPERGRVFIVNFEHISHLFLVFLLLTLNRLMLAGIICSAETGFCHKRFSRDLVKFLEEIYFKLPPVIFC